jgi:predicted 2-oxoglutarate/Fe(II)-dependent dioxygenase YbiX/peroxiredoxin
MLLPGDPAPWFQVASCVNPKFTFDTVAGRYVVISFFGSSQLPSSAQFLAEIAKRGARFDVTSAVFFGVTNDPSDIDRIQFTDPGQVFFYDLDLAVSQRFGLVEKSDGASDGTSVRFTRKTFILDHALRVLAVVVMDDDNVPAQIDGIFSVLESVMNTEVPSVPPPVLVVPYVFEPQLCQHLINYYETVGGIDSGYMRDEHGRTVGVIDHSHKRRMDCEVADNDLVAATQERIKRRIVPAIQRAYQFDVTRIERHIVSCYDAAQGAHFRAHRDNTTLGTAHRRFAITINLNSPDYEGGEIWFPEFGPHKYKAPSGAAIVFSCSLLHEVPRVTRGKRYAFLPFLYDEAAAAIRERNREQIVDVSRAVGGKVTHVCDTPTNGNTAPSKSTVDGNSGCGNPEGCNTCLTSATYQLSTPAARADGQTANS